MMAFIRPPSRIFGNRQTPCFQRLSELPLALRSRYSRKMPAYISKGTTIRLRASVCMLLGALLVILSIAATETASHAAAEFSAPPNSSHTNNVDHDGCHGLSQTCGGGLLFATPNLWANPSTVGKFVLARDRAVSGRFARPDHPPPK